jgi:hypothetical protein
MRNLILAKNFRFIMLERYFDERFEARRPTLTESLLQSTGQQGALIDLAADCKRSRLLFRAKFLESRIGALGAVTSTRGTMGRTRCLPGARPCLDPLNVVRLIFAERVKRVFALMVSP